MPKQMTVAELQHTHEYYDAYKNFWDFMLASYEGIRALIAGGHVLFKHERETQANYDRRVSEAYGFGYSQSIVDIFNFYLFKSPPKRNMGPLSKDKQWLMFNDDCDLYGADFDQWMLESQRYAAILGHVGILVDKGSSDYKTKKQELDNKVYPYVARYFPQNILDWEYERDGNNRPYLSMIKLLDDDGRYRVWTTEEWAVYKPEEEEANTAPTVKDANTGQARGGGGTSGEQVQIDPEDFGPNPFMDTKKGRGEVPFIWMYNLKSKLRNIGVSDIKDVAYIDGSIIRNLSEGEEVITYGAFPMLRTPMREKGLTPADKSEAKDIGITALMEFDPENPESKPDWLEAAVAEPVDAILNWMLRKVEEIYRSSNAGGMAGTEIQTQAKSGTALKAEFQLLNSKLVSKGANTEQAEKGVVRYWGMWQKMEAARMEEVAIEYARTYDIENLAQDLENALTAKTLVMSKTFRAQLQKNVARQMLPAAEPKQLDEIDKEIDEAMAEQDAKPSGAAFGNIDEAGSKPGEGPGTPADSTQRAQLVPITGGAGGQPPVASNTGGGE
jgi:hypothetical protein